MDSSSKTDRSTATAGAGEAAEAAAPAERPRADERVREKDSPRHGSDTTEPPPLRQPWFRRPSRLIAASIALVILAIAGALWWWYRRGFVSTDDAFISAHTVYVSPRVSGQVIGVPVEDNELVHADQPLVKIDPQGFRIALEHALGEQRQARTALQEARASVGVAHAALHQAVAQLASARAHWVVAEQDLKRYRSVNPRAVARTQIDTKIAAERSARADRDAAREHVASAKAQILVAQASVAGAVARVATARAGVRQARLNLSYTTVDAPVTGHVTHKSVAVGTYVTPGQQMMALVPRHLWVTANFKETELTRLRPGESVSVHIDSCPGANARGHINSIARGTGAAFALLPPENATGNYIKVVQRVPVKITLDRVPRGCVLGPGMSVEPTVRVR